MKTTLHVILGTMLAAALVNTRCATASASGIATGVWTALSATGQSGAKKSDPKRDVASLLARARKSMSEADWESAASFLAQAEALNVQFGKMHMGDTPAKVRRDLERLRPVDTAPGRSTAGKRSPAGALSEIPPANQVIPSKQPASAKAAAESRGAAEAHNPFEQQADVADQGSVSAGAAPRVASSSDRSSTSTETAWPPTSNAGSPGRGAQATTPFDTVEQSARAPIPQTAERAPSRETNALREAAVPVETPAPRAMRMASQPPSAAARAVAPAAAAAPQPAAEGNDVRVQSDRLLLAARKALAVGDAATAARLASEAKGLAARYDIHDDTPAKVEAAVQKFNEMTHLAASKDSEAYRRRYVDLLMSQAEAMLSWKEFDDAERLAGDAQRIPVSYGPFDVKPDDLLNRVATARRRSGRFRDNAVAPAGFDAAPARAVENAPVTDTAAQRLGPDDAAMPAAAPRAPAQRALYDADHDTTRNVAVKATTNSRPTAPPEDLFRTPVQPAAAAATQASGEMPAAEDSVDAGPSAAPSELTPERLPPAQENSAGSLLQKAAVDQEVQTRKLVAELAAQQSEAKRIQATDPKRALEVLRQARATVEKSTIDQAKRDQLLRSMDRRIAETEDYIETNRPRIELEERNKAVKDEIDRDQQIKVEVQEKLAMLVDDFNKKMDEHRWAEAEVVAKRAAELAPDEPIVEQLRLQSLVIKRLAKSKQIQSDKEQGFVDAMNDVEQSSTPFDDNKPYQFGDVTEWEKLTQTRKKRDGRRKTEKEIEIEQRLKTPVSLKFQDVPLSQVVDQLRTLASVNIHLDPRGLAAEGITTDTPVTIDLTEPISLKSALNLVLEPLHLSYIVKNEVLTITSEQLRDSEVVLVTYSVADLVVPIPNFTPDANMGLTGALNSAQANARAGMVGGVFAGDAPLAVASATGANTNAVMDPRILANLSGSSGTGSGMSPTIGGGPGGLAGGAQPDFDSLIDLIQQTIQPDSWDANGGPGSVQRFQNNLSLVISQKQDVHDEIADLLAQLRRLQDLQVTIEVRFITLNDNFFERIGVSFDFVAEAKVPPAYQAANAQGTLQNADFSRKTSATVGTQAAGIGAFTDDLNIPLTQGSFSAAVPQFGGFAAGSGATLGFAILSDLEAYFFIEASQGDRRSNVLQAPKVTLFNGQQAFVSDTSQSPFVISVIPVVGDFAAAQQPVIVVLSEGTMLTVQAVVSEDRRFVRLTLVPFFSSIGDVNTFTFTGSSSSTTNSASTGPNDATTGRINNSSTTSEGTTVQLPTFAFTSVSTTVSVPDGGTVLLGGIKRLSEGRNEFGVPILSKLPYVDRLFRNVGIGRQTQSLMMMVTPRIIIQEEEEYNLTGQNPPNP